MPENLQASWEELLPTLDMELMPATINSWIRPLKPKSFDERVHTLTLEAPSETYRDTFRNRYERVVTAAARTAFDDPELKLLVLTRDEITAGQDRQDPNEAENGVTPSNLNGRYTFDNFVRGTSNELAFSACVYVAQFMANINSEDTRRLSERANYNPLFLYSGVGLGKTHLMHSIGNYIKHIDPSIRVIYVTAENLTNEFITSIREHKNQEFRDKYRTIDALLVDDIQFLADKEGTQDEFFHTFNALYNANRQIVISSDRPPSELVSFTERLNSRFNSGTLVDISAPDFETRIAILEKKLELRSLSLSADVVRLIAKSVSSNIRALEGALNTVANFSKLTNTPITLDLAERALKNKVTEIDRRVIDADLIQEETAKYFKISKEELKSRRRTANITYVRHIAMYLCRMIMDATHVQIGQYFGNRDHTSVIYACNKVENELETNVELKKAVFELEKLIKGE